MRSASSWNVVDVVRPQPGQAVTDGAKDTDAQRLQKLARRVDLFAPIAAGPRRQRDADRVADALVQEHAHRRGGPDEALHAHAGLGQSEVERLVGARGELAIDRDQVERPRDLARDDDLVLAQPRLQRELGRLEGGEDHALVDDFLGGVPEVLVGVLLHLLHDELLVQGAAIDADADGLGVLDGDLADRRELLVAPNTLADVAGIDPVLVEGPGAVGVLRQKDVPVVVKVSDQGSVDPRVEHPLLDLGHGGCGLGDVDRDPDHLRAGPGELDALGGGGFHVHRVGVRHRLDDDGGAAADHDLADADPHGGVAFARIHGHFNLPDDRRS